MVQTLHRMEQVQMTGCQKTSEHFELAVNSPEKKTSARGIPGHHHKSRGPQRRHIAFKCVEILLFSRTHRHISHYQFVAARTQEMRATSRTAKLCFKRPSCVCIPRRDESSHVQVVLSGAK